MLNADLWTKILAFDLDNPQAEYGFSTRLAKENYWTKNFTEEAIIEYKKFMFLAALSDFMVSPSEIVDTVWHQHLIFTQSYQEFCEIIGKQVQHIPSTHNKSEAEKFKLAKERTKVFYRNNFGDQPSAFGEYSNMYDSLHLKKARLKIRTFLLFGIIAFVALTIPAYIFLMPLYITINNPAFIIAFIGLTILIFAILELYNRSKLYQITNSFSKASFIFNLQPLELVYLKTQRVKDIINATVNELIKNRVIKVLSNNSLQLSGIGATDSMEQLQVVNVLHDLNISFYQRMQRQLEQKPIFSNTPNCMDAFQKYFNKSSRFGSLFYMNFSVLAILYLLGFNRLMTGIAREKPVTEIWVVIVILTVLTIAYLNRLTKLVCIETIPSIYKKEILPSRQIEGNWQWHYFLMGTAALVGHFAPIVNFTNKSDSSSSSCGTSCGSSCGSSCSSCGGCGGD